MSNIVVEGYLTQEKLEKALKEIVGQKVWLGRELLIPETRQRLDMAFRKGNQVIIVEFDGDEHYRNSLKIKNDLKKNNKARELGYKIVRIPYWIQLTNETFWFYFNFKANIEQNFPHGFITTKIFPASFCELGLKRFKEEIGSLPDSVRNAVIDSLTDRIGEYGIDYVLPATLRHLIRK